MEIVSEKYEKLKVLRGCLFQLLNCLYSYKLKENPQTKIISIQYIIQIIVYIWSTPELFDAINSKEQTVKAI